MKLSSCIIVFQGSLIYFNQEMYFYFKATHYKNHYSQTRGEPVEITIEENTSNEIQIRAIAEAQF